jgi:hypothetical protein
MKRLRIYCHDQKFEWWDFRRYTTAIIKIFSNDIFYHQSFILGNQVYESNAFKGVVYREGLSSESSLWFEIALSDKQYYKLKAVYDALVGRPYDYLAIIVGFFGLKIENSKAFYCSELLNPIFYHIFGIKTREFKTNLTPKDARMILTTIAQFNDKVVICAK